MAYFVARKLHMRPNDILDKWGVPELLVAYGHYANEDSYKNFSEWKNLDPKSRAKTQKPTEYAVKFHSFDDMGD